MASLVTATLFTDGGARGNPGPGGIGYVLKIEDGPKIKFSKYVGKVTNNQAEYLALLEGLKKAKAKRVETVECFLDSELVVRQMNGQYKIKNMTLADLAGEVEEVMKAFRKIQLRHVTREKNREADNLVNLAIDRQQKPPPKGRG